MMFLITQGEKTVVIGAAEERHCPRCDEERDFVPELQYKYAGVDLFFGMTYSKRYQLACPECNHGWILDPKAIGLGLERNPIPFRMRYGLLLLVVSLFGLYFAGQAYQAAG